MGRSRIAHLLLGLLLSLFPLRSFAGAIISVSMMPPPLPAYNLPPCPDQNLVWVPGYWGWFQNNYYWVPGAWVEPPFAGAMWTPSYWSWSHHVFTMYTWHSGYWSYHVGYYGGVNYGYGYGGFGYSGGVWHGGLFAYNLEIVPVDNRWVRETFRDPGLVDRGYIDRNNHSGFNGGPGGVDYHISPEEQAVEHEKHWEPTAFQVQYETGIRSDQTYWYNTNHGQPAPAQLTYATPLFVDPSHEHRDWNEHKDLYLQRDQIQSHDQPDRPVQPEHPETDARYRPGNNKVDENPNGQPVHPEEVQHPQGGNEFEHNRSSPAGQNPASETSPNPSGTEPPANAQTPNPNPHPESKDKKPAPKPAPKPKSDKDKKTN
jgi:hypothetical protein